MYHVIMQIYVLTQKPLKSLSENFRKKKSCGSKMSPFELSLLLNDVFILSVYFFIRTSALFVVKTINITAVCG